MTLFVVYHITTHTHNTIFQEILRGLNLFVSTCLPEGCHYSHKHEKHANESTDQDAGDSSSENKLW